MNLKRGMQTAARGAKLARIAGAARQIGRSEGPAREAAKRSLALLMADARGVPMKIGQFLSSRDDSGAFDLLVRGIPARPLEEMLSVLETRLGCPSGDVFESIDESLNAASLGQVHRAVLKGGREVAVKLRYPDIADAVEAELLLAGLMPGVGPAKKWGFNVDAYKAVLRDNMDRELDYLSEADRQARFREAVRVPGLVVPEVYRDLCGEGVLVQSWESGLPLDAAAQWPPEERIRVATILMGAFFQSLFVAGHVHCDPNLGNLLVRREGARGPEVVLLDYGCMVPVEERARLALLKLILGCIEGDDTDPLACFVEMGFELDKLSPIADIIPALCKVLFEPFLREEPYSTKYWSLNERANTLLGELRWWFRSAGPAKLFLLMRAFSGMVSHLDTVKIIVPWRKVLFEAVGGETLARARAFEPAPTPSHVARNAMSFKSVASLLRVHVTEEGRDVVKVSMPAGQICELETLVPEDVVDKIRDSDVDLDAIQRRACESGIVPQELFELDTGRRHYRVWLE